MAIFQKGDICYPIYGMGGAMPEAIDQRYSNMTFASNEAGFTVIETTSDKETHTFYANNDKKMIQIIPNIATIFNECKFMNKIPL